MEERKNITTVNIDKITFSYGKRKIFDNFSLQIPFGISLGLLGGNGSGKTTLMKLIAGLEKPKSGNIRILDHDSIHRVRSKIGYMPQQNTLYSDLSVFNNIDFFACMYGLHNKIIRKESERLLKLINAMSSPIPSSQKELIDIHEITEHVIELFKSLI